MPPIIPHDKLLALARWQPGSSGSQFPITPTLPPLNDASFSVRYPGRSDLGNGLSPETKSRIFESLAIGLDRLVSRIKPGPHAIAPQERFPIAFATSDLASREGIGGIPNRTLIMLALVGVGVFLLAKKL